MEEHIKINLDAFKKLDEDFLEANRLKYALLHDGELVDVYNDLDDTYKIGQKLFPQNDFLIRQILAPEASFGSLTETIVAV